MTTDEAIAAIPSHLTLRHLILVEGHGWHALLHRKGLHYHSAFGRTMAQAIEAAVLDAEKPEPVRRKQITGISLSDLKLM